MMFPLWGFRCVGRCSMNFRIVPEKKDDEGLIAELLQSDPRCPTCAGELHILPYPPSLNEEDIEDLKIQDLWNDIHGVGKDGEQISGQKGIDRVRETLFMYRVVSVNILESDTGRCVIKSLMVDSGSVLHFAVGSGEPVIYKITQEKDHGR